MVNQVAGSLVEETGNEAADSSTRSTAGRPSSGVAIS